MGWHLAGNFVVHGSRENREVAGKERKKRGFLLRWRHHPCLDAGGNGPVERVKGIDRGEGSIAGEMALGC